jgi:hypothetical protein
MLKGNMHSPMRSWPMTDWDHDDHEKGAYHEAGHAAVLWTFGVPPTGAVHLEHETHGGCTATELGAATRLSPSTKSLRGSPAGERLAAARNGSACPHAAGGGGGGFGGLGGGGFGGLGGSMGQPILGGFDLAGRGQRLPSRIRRTIGSSASVIQGVNPRGRGGYHRGWRAPLPKRKSTNPPANSCGREVILPISNCSRN